MAAILCLKLGQNYYQASLPSDTSFVQIDEAGCNISGIFLEKSL